MVRLSFLDRLYEDETITFYFSLNLNFPLFPFFFFSISWLSCHFTLTAVCCFEKGSNLPSPPFESRDLIYFMVEAAPIAVRFVGAVVKRMAAINEDYGRFPDWVEIDSKSVRMAIIAFYSSNADVAHLMGRWMRMWVVIGWSADDCDNCLFWPST